MNSDDFRRRLKNQKAKIRWIDAHAVGVCPQCRRPYRTGAQLGQVQSTTLAGQPRFTAWTCEMCSRVLAMLSGGRKVALQAAGPADRLAFEVAVREEWNAIRTEYRLPPIPPRPATPVRPVPLPLKEAISPPKEAVASTEQVKRPDPPGPSRFSLLDID